MTRAVVRAMDVVQEICASNHKEVEEFFVAGASKRGWTTWTGAAVDDRVMGIAPSNIIGNVTANGHRPLMIIRIRAS